MTITYVTVTYNAAAVLQRTLDSILSQDYPFITHLIIDGASTDGTLQMVDDYIRRSNEAGNGHRIQVMSEPDHGIYDAMNKGIRSLDGDYVCFLNAGDFLPATDSASRIAAAVCPFSHRSHNGDSPLCDKPAVLYGDTDIVDGCHQAFYARTDFAIATPYDLRYRYSADVDWCIRIMKAAAKERVPLLNLHMVVANYTEEGQTTLHHRESLKERYQVMSRHYGPVSTFLMHCWFVVRSVFK